MPEVKPCFCGNENLTICCPFCKEPHPIDDWNKIYPFKSSPPTTLVPLDVDEVDKAIWDSFYIPGETSGKLIESKAIAKAICMKFGQPRRGEEK